MAGTNNSCDYAPTQYNVLTGGANGTINNVSPGSTSGYVLTSNGASSQPSFQAAAASGITTIDGDSGSVTGSTVTIYAHNSTQNCGSSVKFSGSSSTLTFNVTDGSNNTIIGNDSGNSSLSGENNTVIGASAGQSFTSGINNTFVGYQAGQVVTTGNYNTFIGEVSGNAISSGGHNIGLGYAAGGDYTSSESSNIVIGNFGTIGESNVIRIGTQGSSTGQQNACYIAGIEGVSVSNLNIVTINTSTGQMGSEASVGVANGGTGDTSFTAYSVVCGGTTSTGALQNVSGVGSSGQVLTSNGASALPTWQAAAAGGLVKIASQTASSSSSIAFTSDISATYNTYLLVFSNVVGATTSENFNLQVSTNNGSSYISSGYSSVTNYQQLSGGGITEVAATSACILAQSVSNTSTNGLSGHIWMQNFNNSTYFLMNGMINYLQTGAPGQCAGTLFGYYPSAAVNAFQLLFASGNITSGTFTLYGISGS